MTPTISSTRRRNRFFTGFIFWFAGLLASGLVVFLGTLLVGHVVGEEFCPQTFSRRSFHYLEIPLAHLQVTPVRRNDHRGSCEQLLVRQRLVTAAAGVTPRWDLVSSRSASFATVRGDAAILCDYLDARDDKGNAYWERWTEQHSEMAKILWPAVARLAERQLYILTPDLFDAARRVETPEALQAALARSLTASGRRLAEVQNDPALARLGEEVADPKSETTPANSSGR